MANTRSKREAEDTACKQLFTRVTGGVSIFVAFVLMIVSVILMSMDCCGDHFSYDEKEWERQCKGKVDKAAEDGFEKLGGTDRKEDEEEAGGASATSCYHRNIVIFVTVGFLVFLLFVGIMTIIIGECMYDVNRDRDEDHVVGVASHMKWLEMQQLEEEREQAAYEREQAEYERELEEMRMQNSFSAERMPRANSIGSPMTPSQAHLQRQPTVVASVPAPYVVGNARP